MPAFTQSEFPCFEFWSWTRARLDDPPLEAGMEEKQTNTIPLGMDRGKAGLSGVKYFPEE
jgi:hypothetical protein